MVLVVQPAWPRAHSLPRELGSIGVALDLEDAPVLDVAGDPADRRAELAHPVDLRSVFLYLSGSGKRTFLLGPGRVHTPGPALTSLRRACRRRASTCARLSSGEGRVARSLLAVPRPWPSWTQPARQGRRRRGPRGARNRNGGPPGWSAVRPASQRPSFPSAPSSNPPRFCSAGCIDAGVGRVRSPATRTRCTRRGGSSRPRRGPSAPTSPPDASSSVAKYMRGFVPFSARTWSERPPPPRGRLHLARPWPTPGR